MLDQYTKVTKTSWFSRLGGSIKGILFGFLLFIAAFGVLYWNEGRADLSRVADNATPISATAEVEESLNGTLVAASGILSSEEMVGDGQYLKPGNYLKVSRSVEMFAWVEKSKSETDTKLGGAQETTTNYTYEKDWVRSPEDSSSFKIPTGHSNPAKTIEDSTKTVGSAKVGNYIVEPDRLALVGSEKVALTAENTELTFKEKLAGGYVFVGRGSVESPWVGDMRIGYSAIPSGQDVTVLGKVQGQKLSPFFDKDGNKLYRAFRGDLDTAISTLGTEHSRSTWIWRVIGFLMMWFGLSSIFAPLSVLLDVLPILGSISRTAVGLVTFVASLVLSVVTILISMILHNIWAVILIVIVVAGGLGVMIKKKLKEQKGKPKKAASSSAKATADKEKKE